MFTVYSVSSVCMGLKNISNYLHEHEIQTAFKCWMACWMGVSEWYIEYSKWEIKSQLYPDTKSPRR